jgi:hypothetical protein
VSSESISLRVIPGLAAPAQDAKTLPARLKLLNWGTNPTIYGDIVLDDTSAEVFAANQRKIGREEVALDFEHNTVPGTAEYDRSQEPRPIAAMGSPVIVRGDGLYLEQATWTKTGTETADNFKDLSPAVFLDGQRVIGMHSAALTKTGAVYGLTLFAASSELQTMLQTLSASLTPAGTQPNTPHTMPENTPAPAPDLAAINARLDQLEAIAKQLAAPDAPALVPLSARIAALESQIQTNSQTADERERAALLAGASTDGKVIPLSADGLKLVPTAALKEIVAGLPKNVVPLSASTKPNADTKPALKGLARTAAAINAQLGKI